MTRHNIRSLLDLEVAELVQFLYDRLVEEVPEGAKTEEDIEKIEKALGRLANHFAFVMEMLALARHLAKVYKREGDKERTDDMMSKRDALEDLGSVIKLQWQAVSRMLTAREQRREENDLHEYRKERTGKWGSS